MRHALASALVLVGCNEVRIDPVGGGAEGGAPPASAGGAPSLGGASQGGAGRGGGEPDSVPGCEALLWAGDPFLIPTWHPRWVLLAPLADGRVGIVYVEGTQGSAVDRLTSFVIDDAFDSWPPSSVGEPAVHLEGESLFGSRSLTSRADGTFALAEAGGIYRFGEPGVVLTTPSFTSPFVGDDDPGAYFVERDPTEPLRFFRRASLDPLAPEEALGEMPLPDFCSRPYAELTGTPTFLFASQSECNDGSGDAWAQFYQPGPTQIQAASITPLPFFPEAQQLLPRPGGFWYAISRPGTTEVRRLTPTTTELGERIVYETGSLDAAELGLWRDGFALTVRTEEGIRVEVSNGKQTTHGLVQGPGTFASLDETKRLLPGGTNDRSILVAVPQLDGIALLRADCAGNE